MLTQDHLMAVLYMIRDLTANNEAILSRLEALEARVQALDDPLARGHE